MEIRIKSVYKSKTLQHQLPPTQGRGQASYQSPVIGAVVPPTPTPVSSATAPPPASAAATSSSFTQASNLASFQDTAAAETSAKEDETLKMLQRHYLQAILTLAPPHKLSVSR